MNRRLATLSSLALLASVAVGCTDSSESDADAVSIDVESSDDACTLSATTAVAGSIVFSVENTGNDTTEFYLYDGDTVVGEVENIGPGLTRELTVEVDAGEYTSACKPGMEGDGIRAAFTVTG